MNKQLLSFGTLSVTGEKSEALLQGQLTYDLGLVTSETNPLCAHLNPHGRIVSLFYLSKFKMGFNLSMPMDLIPITKKALEKYAVFYKVEFTESIKTDEVDAFAFIQKKIPVIFAATSGLFLPHELNLIELGAVSLNKGCYTGQEIVARMHYKGKTKKILCHHEFTTKRLPQPGDTIYMGEQKAGVLLNAVEMRDNTYSTLLLLDTRDFMNKQLLMEPSSC
jgi:tRNA-modifying protein YgfZ